MEFTVLGTPAPAGSKRGFVNKKTGAVILTDANKNAKPWQAEVRNAAWEALPDHWLLMDGPVKLTLRFYRPRPKAHYGTGRNSRVLKDSAPPYPTGRPDALKLARAVEDALTGIIWRDDSQIVVELLEKHYGEPARCEVVVEDFTP